MQKLLVVFGVSALLLGLGAAVAGKMEVFKSLLAGLLVSLSYFILLIANGRKLAKLPGEEVGRHAQAGMLLRLLVILSLLSTMLVLPEMQFLYVLFGFGFLQAAVMIFAFVKLL